MAEVFDINIAIANSNDILTWVERISLEIEAGFAKAGEKGGQKLSEGVKQGLKATVADAQAPLEELGNSFDALGSRISRILEIATGIGLERLFEQGITGIKDFISSGIELSGQLESNRVGFETMLGSADKAGQLLTDLATFAKTTPFEFPELVETSKKLLAFGYSSGEVIGVMNDLGNISSVIGKEKLPFITHALGQVRTEGKLTGYTLNEFTRNSVPLLDVLAKQFGN